jgi:type I restriction enzyme, R subunit
MKEAAARIKINKLLEAAGWRFFTDAKPATSPSAKRTP